ncbi:MAG: V-type ATP synthase subunit E family protein [Candidatus Omnitrophota bacterium]|jgi:vacuolar-type H+-ATPase subunit E/Vma4
MAEQIKDLIEKINQEGVRAAEENAREIKKEAVKKAAVIIEKATVEAHGIVLAAKDEVFLLKKNTTALLGQAARDMLLGLKKEIIATLDALIVSNIRQALSPEELAKILASLIKEASAKENAQTIVSLKKEDCAALEKYFIEKLKDQFKAGITLKPSEDVLGGFVISYDGGKSHFDFTDKALAEYIGAYLKPALKAVLKDV